MSDVGDAENTLKALGNFGVDNASTIGALPNAAGLNQQAGSLTDIVGTPIDFSAQQQIIGQSDVATSNLFQLGQQLGVQKAVSAMLADKASRQGKASADTQAENAQQNIAQVGAIGQQEQEQLLKSGLSQQSVGALGRLHITAQQLQQQGLQNTARNAKTAAQQDILLAQQQGAQQVGQAGQTALLNEQALEQQYQKQQFDFWSRIASALLTATGAVGGYLIGGPVGAAAGAGLATSLTQENTPQPVGLNAYQVGTSPAIGTDVNGAGATANNTASAYTVLPDSLPVV